MRDAFGLGHGARDFPRARTRSRATSSLARTAGGAYVDVASERGCIGRDTVERAILATALNGGSVGYVRVSEQYERRTGRRPSFFLRPPDEDGRDVVRVSAAAPVRLQRGLPQQGADRGDEADIAGYVSVSRLLRLSPERRAAIRVYTGHFPFVASELLDLDLVTMTLLRDPVERTISVLKHFKRLSRRYHSHELDDIYEDPFVFAHFIENHQTRMFSVTADDKPEAFGSNMSYWATASLLGLGKPPSDDDEARDEIDRERAVAVAESSIVDESRFEVAIAAPRQGRRHRFYRALRRVHRGVAPALRMVAGRARHQGQGEPQPRGLGGVARAPRSHRRRQRVRHGALPPCRASRRAARPPTPGLVSSPPRPRRAKPAVPRSPARKGPARRRPARRKPARRRPGRKAAGQALPGPGEDRREWRAPASGCEPVSAPSTRRSSRRSSPTPRITALYRAERADFRGRADGLAPGAAADVRQRRVPRGGVVPGQGPAAGSGRAGAARGRPSARDDDRPGVHRRSRRGPSRASTSRTVRW